MVAWPRFSLISLFSFFFLVIWVFPVVFFFEVKYLTVLDVWQFIVSWFESIS